MNIKSMTLDELLALTIDIKNEISNRKSEIEKIEKHIDTLNVPVNNSIELMFNARSSKSPYIATCTYDKLEYGSIKRDFKYFDKTKDGGYTVCSGKYTVSEGEILDIRDSYGRDYFIVEGGKLLFLTSYDDGTKLMNIIQYLKKDISKDTLFELLEIKQIEIGVIDELKD